MTLSLIALTLYFLSSFYRVLVLILETCWHISFLLCSVLVIIREKYHKFSTWRVIQAYSPICPPDGKLKMDWKTLPRAFHFILSWCISHWNKSLHLMHCSKALRFYYILTFAVSRYGVSFTNNLTSTPLNILPIPRLSGILSKGQLYFQRIWKNNSRSWAQKMYGRYLHFSYFYLQILP